MVLVRADPQLLIADARLNVVERRQYAGLENVEAGRDMKSGDLDRAAEIVRCAESVRRRMRNDLVEERLPSREIGVTAEGQPHPIRRVDERRVALACSVQPGVARRGRGRSHIQLRGAYAKTLHHRLAMRR